MRDLATEIRRYYDSTAEPVRAEEVFGMRTQTDPRFTTVPPRRRPWAIAVAAAALTLVAVGSVVLLLPGTETPPVVTDPPTTTVATSVPPSTTAVPVTSVPATTSPPAPATTTSLADTTTTSLGNRFFPTVSGAPFAEQILEASSVSDSLLVIGPSGSWISDDGSSWSGPHDVPFATDHMNLVAAGDLLFAIGVTPEGSGRSVLVWVSPDGIEWTAADVEDASLGARTEDPSQLALAPSADGFVLAGDVCDPDCVPRVWTSETGLSWTTAQVSGLGERFEDGFGYPRITSLIETPTGIVAGGSASTERQLTPYPVFLASSDGEDWETLEGAGPGAVGTITAIAESEGTSVAITGPPSGLQADAAQVYRSEDGRTWTWVTALAFFQPDGDLFVEGLAAVDGWFVVYGTKGGSAFAAVSPDGWIWQDEGTLGAGSLEHAASTGDLLLLSGRHCDAEACEPFVWTWSP